MGCFVVLVGPDVGRLIVRQPVDVGDAVVLAAIDLAGDDGRGKHDRSFIDDGVGHGVVLVALVAAG